MQNHPSCSRACCSTCGRTLPEALRQSADVHTFIYNPKDRGALSRDGLCRGLPFVLQRKLGYRAFVRFIAGCDGVVATSPRAAFWDAARFFRRRSDVQEFSATTASSARGSIPGSQVAMFDTVRLRELLRRDAFRHRRRRGRSRLLPSSAAAAEVWRFHRQQRASAHAHRRIAARSPARRWYLPSPLHDYR